jgi:hypothetical protein
MTAGGEVSPGEAAELVEEWCDRLDRFCAALALGGWRVQRDGLSVRIDPPAEPGAAPTGWEGSSL